MQSLKLFLLLLIRKFGLIIKKNSPKNSEALMIQYLLSLKGINCIFDIGANKGQFAESLLKSNSKTKVVSFEPLHEAYQILDKKTEKYSNWTAHNIAVGSEVYETEINVSANSHSSSILKVNENHLKAEGSAKIIAQQKIQVKPLNEIVELSLSDKILLKIDTQGFEHEVLKGSEQLFKSIEIILIELSFVPLYDDSKSFSSLVTYLENKGFELYQLYPEFTDPNNHRLLQANGIFIKKV